MVFCLRDREVNWSDPQSQPTKLITLQVQFISFYIYKSQMLSGVAWVVMGAAAAKCLAHNFCESVRGRSREVKAHQCPRVPHSFTALLNLWVSDPQQSVHESTSSDLHGAVWFKHLLHLNIFKHNQELSSMNILLQHQHIICWSLCERIAYHGVLQSQIPPHSKTNSTLLKPRASDSETSTTKLR